MRIANIAWKATNASGGKGASLGVSSRPARPMSAVSMPMIPSIPTYVSLPAPVNAIAYPYTAHSTATRPIAPKDIIIMLTTDFAFTSPP